MEPDRDKDDDKDESPAERIAKASGRPKANLHKPLVEPPASNSMFWKPKGEKPQEDAPWIKDHGTGGKQ
jgi:hypothetical protein